MRAFIIVLFSIFTSKYSSAQWNNNPSLNTSISTGGDKSVRSSNITTDGGNGYYITWNEMDMSTSEHKIYVQKLNNEGVAMWPGKGSLVLKGNFSVLWPKAMASKNGVFVVWQDSRKRPFSGLHSIYAQFINLNGIAEWSLNGKPVYDNPTTNSMSPQIVADGEDGIIVSWWEHISLGTLNSKILAQRLSTTGNLMWPNDYKVICDVFRRIEGCKMISDQKGGAIFGWADFRNSVNNSKSDIYAQRISQTGEIMWQNNGEVICSFGGNQNQLDLTTDGSGGGVLAWRDYRKSENNETTADLYCQRISDNGVKMWSEGGVLVSKEGINATEPSVAFDGNRNTFIVWASVVSSFLSIEGQVITNNGDIKWQSPLQINDGTNGLNNTPFISNDGSGGAIISWSRMRTSTQTEIVAQHLYADGTFQWDKNGMLVCNAPNKRTYYKDVVPSGYATSYSDGDGSKVLAWVDDRANSQDLYATKIFTKPPIPKVLNVFNHCSNSSATKAKLLNPPFNTLVKIHINENPIEYNYNDSTFTYFTPNLTPLGKHKITISYENKSGISVKDTLFEHQEVFAPQLIITSSRDIICKGETLSFQASVPNIPLTSITFNWKLNNIDVNVSTPTFNPAILNDGDIVSCDAVIDASVLCIYKYTATSNLITITVKNYIKPVINITMLNANTCIGDTIHFVAKTDFNTDNLKYTWIKNGETVGENKTTFSTHIFKEKDKIECWGYPINESCFDDISKSNAVILNIDKTPIITVYPKDTVVSFNSQIQLLFTTTEPLLSYSWEPKLKLVNSSIPSPLTVPIQKNEKFDLHVISTNGCKAEKTITLRVANKFLMPSAFTPNSDGKNDIFRIPENTLTNISSFTIYNRWGQQIFSTNNVNDGWDGFYKGKKSNSGLYVYIIKTKENNLGTIKGTFVLIN